MHATVQQNRRRAWQSTAADSTRTGQEEKHDLGCIGFLGSGRQFLDRVTLKMGGKKAEHPYGRGLTN